jgi:hypothetical protein
MKIFRYARAGAAALTLALGGCATYTARYVNDVHPQWGQAELNRDNYQCLRENAAPGSSGELLASTSVAIAQESSGIEVNPELRQACLSARGWRETTAWWKKL